MKTNQLEVYVLLIIVLKLRKFSLLMMQNIVINKSRDSINQNKCLIAEIYAAPYKLRVNTLW